MEEEVDRESAILLALGGVLHREIAIDDLLARLVDHIATAMSADRGTIYLLDRRTDELFSRVAHLPELSEIRLAMGQGVAGHVAGTGDTVNVPTVDDERRFYRGVDAQTGYQTRSMLAVPMRDQAGEVLGVVQLLNKRGERGFDAEDEQRLARLARQAAFAIEATTLYDELRSDEPRPADSEAFGAHFNRIVGEAPGLREAYRLVSKAAATEATVLIRGESGTGKELFARAVHVNSPRADGPFVKVDCAALPESLIENELFGHEAGAYTGADRRAEGKVDAALGGTLFLDEIGELPAHVQGKLLRVLQDRTFFRVGGNEALPVDARVVAATNRPLEDMVRAGTFRADLYYRIKVVEVKLPALRERGDRDIARLVRHFIAVAARRHGRPVPGISPDAMASLQAYRWPGNVRELENCIESAVVVMDGDHIEHHDLPLPSRPPPSSRGQQELVDSTRKPLTLAEVERRHILRVLEQSEGNRTLAAQRLGIGRNTLTRKLKKYD